MPSVFGKSLLRRFDETFPHEAPCSSRDVESRAVSAMQSIATISGLPLLAPFGPSYYGRKLKEGERLPHLALDAIQCLPTMVDVTEYVPVEDGNTSTARFANGWWLACGRFAFSSLGSVFTGGHTSPRSTIAPET